MLNETALKRLAELGRGKTLPWRSLSATGMKWIRRCDCGQCYRKPRLTCPKCGTHGGAWPRPRCRLCDGVVPARRRSWCGDECVHAYSMMTDSGYVRARVWERDQGVCRECGLDTKPIDARIAAMSPEQRREAVNAMVQEFGFKADLWHGRLQSLWEADHIEPLAEGGGWALENLQSLCVPCHKGKTAEQAGRKARQRRLVGRKYRKMNEAQQFEAISACLQQLSGGKT